MVAGVGSANGPLTIENRSADMHTFKQFSLVDMHEMNFTSAFDDG